MPLTPCSFGLAMAKVPATRWATRADLMALLMKSRQTLDSHASTRVNLGRLSRQAGLSEYHLHRLFRTVFGETPAQYAIRRRLEIGHGLLANSTRTIGEIAIEVGYHNPDTFARAYRKKYGLSPRVARKDP